MKSLILMSALVAIGLATAFTLPARNATAAESCQSASDLGCNMPAGAFFGKQPAQYTPSVKHRRPLAAANALAIENDFKGGNRRDICDMPIGTNDSGTPAYLYGRC